ncbi:MAG: superoxide dismutase [Alphaproteobacteria bacterium]|nr:superoxide dismutase [Alphaproteobacteria bacterium]
MFSAQMEYSDQVLEPFLSSETINFHYGKHHVGYANTLNSLIKETEFHKLPLEQIIIQSRSKHPKIFNNASQLFNHNFYWKCLKKACNAPSGKLLSLINKQFGSFDKFLEDYITFAGTMFGSGWSWLVEENGKLKFLNTSNAENPIGSDAHALCVIDLWEHAYYIDYRNNRADYISKIVTNCINWNFCESLLTI